MRRIPVDRRPNASRLLLSQGLVFTDLTSPGSKDPYWPDDRYYSFTQEEIECLEDASKQVFNMCCEAIDYMVENEDEIVSSMAIPALAVKQIVESWEREPPWGSVYGRFDVCFGGLDHEDPRLRIPKFYEFNADTPTSLIEAADIQWLWLEQTGHGNDQFNDITQRLVSGWKRNMDHIEAALGHKPTVHFAVAEGQEHGEDYMNVMLLAETCRKAGQTVKLITMEDIALNKCDGRFYDGDGLHIDVIFKLYPWEMMVQEEFGEACFNDMERIGQRDENGNYTGGTIWIEPPYKMLWSNKALFAILWSLFKDDPRSKWLLPTYLERDAPESLVKFAKKPIYSREGADIILHEDHRIIQDNTTRMYGAEGHVLQELSLLPAFVDETGQSYYPVLGIWIIDGDAVGMGIREDTTAITTDASVFIPHSISDGPVRYERKPVPDAETVEETIRRAPYEEALGQSFDDLVAYVSRLVA